MGLRVRYFYCAFGINVRILEQPEQELEPEIPRHCSVDRGFRDLALFYKLNEQWVAVGIRQLDVNAGLDGKFSGFRFAGSDMVQLLQLWDGIVVGNNVAPKAPLLAQHLFKQPFVRVRGDAVDLVV